MSPLVKKFDSSLETRIQDARNRLAEFQERSGLTAEDEHGHIYDYIAKIDDLIDESGERLSHADQVVEDWAYNASNVIGDWSERREIKKLKHEADKAERHSEAALDVAFGALNKAEKALGHALLINSQVKAYHSEDADKFSS